MDTAQRGMGLDWPASLELIGRSVEAARDHDGPALLACGAGTDHLGPGPGVDVDAVVAAYETLAEEGWVRSHTGKGTFLVWHPGAAAEPAVIEPAAAS